MSLIWKLLRHHISVGQFIGFAFANLFGMYIILLGIQFYCDVKPIFTAKDSFMSNDFLIVSKPIGTATGLSGRSHDFTKTEIQELAIQPFIKTFGQFTSAEFKVDAVMGVNGKAIISSELPLESVPDEFIDIPLNEWQYSEGQQIVPIILPRSYINMYNFGFARSHSLPKISDGLTSIIDITLSAHGNGKENTFRGKVIGFSSRLNSILVPHKFMEWANERYAPENESTVNRLLIEVNNPTDERIAQYINQKGFEVEDDKLQAEKTTWFLRLTVSIVMIVGLIISILSFYILMLSIYLLVQKNSEKIVNLLLIGYAPIQVAHPYVLLTIALNLFVLAIAWCALLFTRSYYMDILELLFPQTDYTSMLPALTVGAIIFLIVTLLNCLIIYKKIRLLEVKK